MGSLRENWKKENEASTEFLKNFVSEHYSKIELFEKIAFCTFVAGFIYYIESSKTQTILLNIGFFLNIISCFIGFYYIPKIEKSIA